MIIINEVLKRINFSFYIMFYITFLSIDIKIKNH